jgi:hypothetical protein
MSEERTVKQWQEDLGYEPKDQKEFDAKPEKEQREILTRKQNEQEMNAARKTVKAFMETDEYTALPKNVREAIKRMAGKAAGAGLVARPSIIKTEILPKLKKVGDSISELDIFMATKMGRGEFRKKVREYLKSTDAADRQWIEFDEKSESWTLIGKGAKQPKAWAGKPIA